ncbi:predicted protein [Postia placenta Mad-698-R]|nr:predicted protein [Postia placenta Mad-698-R]
MSPSSNRAIIAGSVVGVAAFVVLPLAMAVCYRRHQQKKPIFFRRSRPPPRNILLAGEDMDDYDLGPPMSSYRDTPGTGSAPSLTSHATSYNAGSLQGVPFVPPAPFADPGRVSYSPHLMGMRTSESGSIFQEAVWPPPRSALVDPLLVSSEDLSHIVDDVMGPANPSGSDSSPGSGAGAVRFPGSVATAGQATHARAPSEDPLMGGALESPSHSPRAPTWRSPLSVTNMGSETASVRTAASPPPGARRRFSQGQSHPRHDDEGGTSSIGTYASACDATREECRDVAVLAHLIRARGGARGTLIIRVRLDIVGTCEVYVGKRTATADTIRVEVAVEVIAPPATEKQEDESSEQEGTADTANDTSHNRAVWVEISVEMTVEVKAEPAALVVLSGKGYQHQNATVKGLLNGILRHVLVCVDVESEKEVEVKDDVDGELLVPEDPEPVTPPDEDGADDVEETELEPVENGVLDGVVLDDELDGVVLDEEVLGEVDEDVEVEEDEDEDVEDDVDEADGDEEEPMDVDECGSELVIAFAHGPSSGHPHLRGAPKDTVHALLVRKAAEKGLVEAVRQGLFCFNAAAILGLKARGTGRDSALDVEYRAAYLSCMSRTLLSYTAFPVRKQSLSLVQSFTNYGVVLSFLSPLSPSWLNVLRHDEGRTSTTLVCFLLDNTSGSAPYPLVWQRFPIRSSSAPDSIAIGTIRLPARAQGFPRSNGAAFAFSGRRIHAAWLTQRRSDGVHVSVEWDKTAGSICEVRYCVLATPRSQIINFTEDNSGLTITPPVLLQFIAMQTILTPHQIASGSPPLVNLFIDHRGMSEEPLYTAKRCGSFALVASATTFPVEKCQFAPNASRVALWVVSRSAAGLTPRELAEDCKAKARSDIVNADEKPQLEVPKSAKLAPGSTVQPMATVTLEGMMFSQGGHLMLNKKCKLPEGAFKRAKKGYEEIHVPAPKQKPTQADEFVPISNTRYAGKIDVAMLTILNELGKWRHEETGEFDLDSFKIIYVAPMKALVHEMVGNFSYRLGVYGVKVGELTGDAHMTKQQIAETQIIVMAPENTTSSRGRAPTPVIQTSCTSSSSTRSICYTASVDQFSKASLREQYRVWNRLPSMFVSLNYLQALVIIASLRSLVHLHSVHAARFDSKAAGNGDGRALMSRLWTFLKTGVDMEPGAGGTKLMNLADQVVRVSVRLTCTGSGILPVTGDDMADLSREKVTELLEGSKNEDRHSDDNHGDFHYERHRNDRDVQHCRLQQREVL